MHAVVRKQARKAPRDVWIAADGSMPHHTSLWRPTVEAAHVERSQRVTQSRAADDLYWLGRYSVRADWSMRVLRSAIQRQQEDGLPVEGQIAARRCLEVLLTDKPNATPLHHGEPLAPAIEALIGEMMRGTSANRAFSRTLDGLHRVATLTRDRLSHEAWQTLDRFRPSVYTKPEYRNQGIASTLFKELIQHTRSRVIQLHLTCVTSNLSAIAFYEKQGFKIYGTEPRALKIGDRFFDEHLTILDLI